MGEVLIAGGIFSFLVFLAVGGGFIDWPMLFIAGAAMATLGLAVGVMVGVGYHLALYRALAPMGILKPGWWWRPTSYNEHLPSSKNRRSVMPWFYAGVISMVVALAGCALVFTGILIM